MGCEVALVKISAACSAVPIGLISTEPRRRCSRNQWYFIAMDFDLGVMRGGSVVARIRHAALSSQIVDLIVDFGSCLSLRAVDTSSRSSPVLDLTDLGSLMAKSSFRWSAYLANSGKSTEILVIPSSTVSRSSETEESNVKCLLNNVFDARSTVKGGSNDDKTDWVAPDWVVLTQCWLEWRQRAGWHWVKCWLVVVSNFMSCSSAVARLEDDRARRAPVDGLSDSRLQSVRKCAYYVVTRLEG